MKKKSAAAFAAILILCFSLAACVQEDKEYFGNVSSYSFWDNDATEAIAQYKLYELMDGYLSDGTVRDGDVVSADGKVKKVLFLGWDGVRADALTNVFYDENSTDTNGGYNYQPDGYSGLQRLKESGGLYLAYAGGEKDEDSAQQTSTCAGWTSILTGGWKTLHGVDYNDDIKVAEGADTIMMKYAKKGLSAGLAFDWGQLFDTTWRNEVSYLFEHPELPLRYRDTDRPVASSVADILANEGLSDEDDINALDPEHYNAVAMDEIHEYAEYDIGTRDYVLDRIAAGDDFVGAIFHRPDTNGHTTGFGNQNPHYVNCVRNADMYLYDILLEIERREIEENEEWLVVVTTDHGGSGRDHGAQVYEHRTTWVACSREIDSRYFGNGYDGYNEDH